ncbi:methyltransferase domain-containing protein [Neorhizobium sp. DT-125]|uniref:methyltransferase domain-containing protein n=1 Tax=Neorhizobium sp. DT-125 TaxID=3396163 RepID=UPI003F1934E7
MPHGFERIRPEDYLMRLAATSIGRAYKALAVEELAAGTADVALDLGCGPGADLRALAEAVGSSGRVIGIDHSPDHVGKARASINDLGDRVRVIEGDIHSLELEPNTVTVFTRTACCSTSLSQQRLSRRSGVSFALAAGLSWLNRIGIR